MDFAVAVFVLLLSCVGVTFDFVCFIWSGAYWMFGIAALLLLIWLVVFVCNCGFLHIIWVLLFLLC